MTITSTTKHPSGIVYMAVAPYTITKRGVFHDGGQHGVIKIYPSVWEENPHLAGKRIFYNANCFHHITELEPSPKDII